jgi:hypothetical protein
MKQLLQKEWREQFKIALLGLAIFTALLFMTVRKGLGPLADLAFGAGALSPHSHIAADGFQPLVSADLLTATAWFCAIFGTVLGWLQIQTEKHPDLRAFLLHRPVPRTTLLHGKLLAGLGLYAFAAGLPMASLLVYALIPGDIPAPFEWAMVLPLSNIFLLGLVFYGAGLLTGLRQVRWYGSRCFGVGLAIAATLVLFTLQDYWRASLFIVISGWVMYLAVRSSFQTGGFYPPQPRLGKVALSIACLASGLLLCRLVGTVVENLFPHSGSYRYYKYTITGAGVAYKISEGGSEKPTIVDLNGRPLLDRKTGKPVKLSDFYGLVPGSFSVGMQFFGGRGPAYLQGTRYSEGDFYFSPWQIVDKTLWYITRDGHLTGYDAVTRRSVGSLEPDSNSGQEAPGHVQFDRSTLYHGYSFQSQANESWYRASHQTLYHVDLEHRTVTPIFSTTNSDGIGAYNENPANHEVLVATRDVIQLIAADGHAELAVPYKPTFPDYDNVTVFRLQATNQFVVRFDPEHWSNNRPGKKLLTRFEWVSGQGDIIGRQTAPKLSWPMYNNNVANCCRLVFPTVPRLLWKYYYYRIFRNDVFNQWDALSTIPLLICVLIGWVMGRRYHFTFPEQFGWAVFHALLGIPGLLAFFSVQEWPAKEPCPRCKKLRMVDREHCEHCGAEFAPPERNGTEIFAPAAVPPAPALVGK